MRTAVATFCTFWPPCAAAVEDVDAQVVLVDSDVDFLGLRQHGDRRRRRVNAALRFG